MNKKTENQRRLDYASSVGRFDEAIRKTNILAKSGEGFTFHCPYGMIGVKPDPESISKFIGLLKKFGLDSNIDESIMDCHVDRDALAKGGNVIWESARYGKKKNQITLEEWLEEKGIRMEDAEKPDNVIEFGRRRRKIEDVIDKTGTNGI
jgi:hypothetical protein